MEKDIKMYDIPEEVNKLKREWRGYCDLRDLYVKIPFGYKKAVKCSIKIEELRSKYWEMIRELYPELEGKTLESDEKKLWVKDS